MQATGERLPWLSEEPEVGRRSVPAGAGATGATRSRALWLIYLALILVIAAVGYGAWWLGTRQKEAAPPELPAEQPLAIPVTRVEPATEATTVDDPLNGGNAQAAENATQAAPAEASAPVRQVGSRQGASHRAQPEQPIASERSGSPVGRSVFPADEPVAEPPPLVGPQPVIVYHPQPNRGRVVQLGAFPTRSQAEDAWRKITRRYPYLATKPKMVNTVDVRGLGGGRRTRMYRLQLGTSSQAQSVVICQQLEKAGHSCVVVY